MSIGTYVEHHQAGLAVALTIASAIFSIIVTVFAPELRWIFKDAPGRRLSARSLAKKEARAARFRRIEGNPYELVREVAATFCRGLLYGSSIFLFLSGIEWGAGGVFADINRQPMPLFRLYLSTALTYLTVSSIMVGLICGAGSALDLCNKTSAQRIGRYTDTVDKEDSPPA